MSSEPPSRPLPGLGARAASEVQAALVVSALVAAGLLVARLAGVMGTVATIRLGVALVGLLALNTVTSLLSRLEPLGPPGPLAAATPEGSGAGRPLGLLARARRRLGRKPVEMRTNEPPEVVTLDKLVWLSESSAMDFYSLLRPRLAAVGRRRLRGAGIDPDDEPAVAAALGPGAEWMKPSGPPEDRHAAGVRAEAVLELLRRLESLE